MEKTQKNLSKQINILLEKDILKYRLKYCLLGYIENNRHYKLLLEKI